MVNLKIDNKQICVPEGTTIMDAAAQNGIIIPKLCYLKDINEIAACRVCVVEMEVRTVLSLPVTIRYRKAWFSIQTVRKCARIVAIPCSSSSRSMTVSVRPAYAAATVHSRKSQTI